MSDIADDCTVRALIRRALEEDIGAGDVTSIALVPESETAEALIVSRVAATVSGTTVAARVFQDVDAALRCAIVAADGQVVRPDDTVMRLAGSARSILAAERVALNFLQRLTGIATLTARFVAKAAPHGAAILDTRKTTPGLRVLEKYAVLCGGGANHRMGLYDRILIKDNHRRLWRRGNAGRLDLAIAEARRKYPNLPIEIEVESEAELRTALRGKPDWILLDNMSSADMARCVSICAGTAKIEASGGITLQNIEEVARSGVHAISLGCLTHSAPAADLSLEML
jgi:nicotinate-nucleotide pyrophosphorylase (carboxylating)